MAAPPRGKSFHDRRVRDWQEHCAFRQYIHLNPVKKGLPGIAEQYPLKALRHPKAKGKRTRVSAPHKQKDPALLKLRAGPLVLLMADS
jgi:hypothetical protein